MTGPELRIVGQRIPRLEGGEKVSGRGPYTADIRRPGLLYARLARSVHPHARVRAVDASAALAIDGVREVLSSANIAEHFPDLPPFDTVGYREPRAGQPLPGDHQLFGPIVRYVGDPVAAVVADTDAAAREAAQLVSVDYDPLPAVFDPEAALRLGAPVIHDGAPNNVIGEIKGSRGDPQSAFASAALVIERTFHTSRQKQAQLEPTCCVAELAADGTVTVWTPCQSPHKIRLALAALFGLPQHSLRIRTPFIGGGFGKNDALTAEPYAVALALLTKRPIRLLYTRQEDFVGTDSRHEATATVKAAFGADGSVTAIHLRAVMNGGAYRGHSIPVTDVMVRVLQGNAYRIPSADVLAQVVFTNTPSAGAFRGYGGPQAAFALEQLIDLGATALGQDPLEVRQRMRIRKGDPWGYKGQIMSDGFGKCMQLGAEAVDWHERRARGPLIDGAKRRGLGMASIVWVSSTGDIPQYLDHSIALVHVNTDGTLRVASAGCDLGTGLRTALAQICAEEFGVPLEAVRLVEMDTDLTPFDSGAHTSRSLYRNGQAVQAAAADARRQVLAYAARHLETPAEELELRDAAVSVRAQPERQIELHELLHKAHMERREFLGRGEAPLASAPSFIAQFAEVEVDTETGKVRVLRLVSAVDVGRVINPINVEGSIQGAAAQGIGYALSEALITDPESGATINATMMGYRLPLAAEVPPLEVILAGEPDPSGPFGAKGCGELGIVPTAGAIANAILHATGVPMTELPMTPERVLEALRAEHPESGRVPAAATV